MKPMNTSKTNGPAARQRGFSLLFMLIALAILLVASVVIMRSSNMSLFSSGNLAFKQDMVSRGEAVNSRVYALFRPAGALSSESVLSANLSSQNYSATALTTNNQGIPIALLKDSDFNTIGASSNDISDTDGGLTMRYVIERLCDSTGESQALGKERCISDPDSKPITGGSSTGAATALPPSFSPVYRVTVRVKGPRDSEVFLQSAFLKPN